MIGGGGNVRLVALITRNVLATWLIAVITYILQVRLFLLHNLVQYFGHHLKYFDILLMFENLVADCRIINYGRKRLDGVDQLNYQAWGRGGSVDGLKQDQSRIISRTVRISKGISLRQGWDWHQHRRNGVGEVEGGLNMVSRKSSAEC